MNSYPVQGSAEGDAPVGLPVWLSDRLSDEEMRDLRACVARQIAAAADVQPKGKAPTDEQIITAWDAWPDALINNRRRAIAFVRSLPEQAPAPAQRYAADLADTIQQVANAIDYAGQDPEALIAKVRALAAQANAVARGNGIREALERAAVTGGAAADAGIDGAGVAAAIRALAGSFEPVQQKQP